MDALTAHDAYVDKVLTQREGIFYKIDWSIIMFSNISLSLKNAEKTEYFRKDRLHHMYYHK